MQAVGSLIALGIFGVGLVVIIKKVNEWREDAIRYYESVDQNLE